MFIQLLPTNHGFNHYAILLLITINLLPVTMCYSLRPIWLTNPSSSSSSSSSSSLSSSTSSDYIDTQRLLDSINDLTSSSDSEFDSIDELNSFANNNNLIKLNDANNNNNLNQFKSSSITLPNVNDNQQILIQPWIESEILSDSIGNRNGGGGQRNILIDQKMTSSSSRGSGGGGGNGNKPEIKEDKKRSESRVKKALSLFAHWKPTTYKQHLDDAYSSELVSAVSRGHGRTMGHSLRWG